MPSPLDAWRDYLREFPERDPGFVARRYAFGQLPEAVAEGLRSAITAAPVVALTNEAPEGFEVSPVNEKYQAILNRDHQYREFTPETKEALADAFKCLKGPVAGILRSPWRVLQCRSWTTLPGADEFGPNCFHADGDLEELLKIMIYATPTDSERGCLDVHPTDGHATRIKGPAGVWVLFYNSILKHRGVAPKLQGFMRVATEVTVAPGHRFDLEPKSAGFVARYRSDPRA